MVLHNNAGSTVRSPKDVNVQFVPNVLDNADMNYAVKLLYVNDGMTGKRTALNVME